MPKHERDDRDLAAAVFATAGAREWMALYELLSPSDRAEMVTLARRRVGAVDSSARPARRESASGEALLSASQAARMLGMSVPTFYRKLADGTLARYGVREPNRLTRNRLFYAESIATARDRKRAVTR